MNYRRPLPTSVVLLLQEWWQSFRDYLVLFFYHEWTRNKSMWCFTATTLLLSSIFSAYSRLVCEGPFADVQWQWCAGSLIRALSAVEELWPTCSRSLRASRSGAASWGGWVRSHSDTTSGRAEPCPAPRDLNTASRAGLLTVTGCASSPVTFRQIQSGKSGPTSIQEVHPTSQEQQKADIGLDAAAAQPTQGMGAQPRLK